MVVDDVITKGSLHYTTEKLFPKKIDSKTRREVLDRIIQNILLARRAGEMALDREAPVKKVVESNRKAVKRGFICDYLKGKGDCTDKLLGVLQGKHNLQIPEVDWTRAFREEKGTFIPFGGKIPVKSKKRTINRSYEINRDYLKELRISTSDRAMDMAALLEGASEEIYSRLKDGSVDERRDSLKQLVVDQFLEEISAQLSEKQKTLLREVELRADQNLLVEKYRERIGFESITGGKGSRVKYVVSEKETRDFYDRHQELFAEPVSVELSHIRFGDYETAVRIRQELIKEPGRFSKYAQKYSLAEDARNGGYIGIVKRGAKLPLYKEFGFTLNREGDISVPFTTPRGVEIVKLHKKVIRLRPYGDPYTKRLINEKIQPLKREELLKKEMLQMKKRIKVIIYEGEL